MTEVIKAGYPEKRHGLRRRIAEQIMKIKARRVNRERNLMPFDSVKKMGILFEIRTKEELRMIQDLNQYLSSKGKDIIMVGFFRGKDLPDYCIASKSGYCFNFRDLNFWEIPNTDFLKKYIQIPFDLLINLSQDSIFALDYLISLSQAKIKIGITESNEQGYYDIAIQPSEKLDLEKAIENIFHYLLILNPKTGKQETA
ncbi:MAG: hypothetical protein JXA03_07735 [Bacteroidales bacterium]|nr:hypothetical protein [Bacteroidales bacterium]